MIHYPNVKYQLPNGQWVYHHNAYETDFVYKEIFVDNIYLKHGIRVHDNATIFDVGANIGLFSLYIKNNYPLSMIYAFEPSPATYQILGLNTELFKNDVKIYNCGISNHENASFLYYYPNYSVISGFQADTERYAEILMSGMRSGDPTENLKFEALVGQRLKLRTKYKCQMRTLSNVIREKSINKVDLLKVDVEGLELEVIQGIAESDWRKVHQIAMEVHRKEALINIIAILKIQNFNIKIEEEVKFKSAEVYNVYATRS